MQIKVIFSSSFIMSGHDKDVEAGLKYMFGGTADVKQTGRQFSITTPLNAAAVALKLDRCYSPFGRLVFIDDSSDDTIYICPKPAGVS